MRTVFSLGPFKAYAVLDKVVSSQMKTGFVQNAGDWLRFFFPNDLPPVFLLLHPDLTRYQSWYLFGNWDQKLPQEYQPFYKPFPGMHEENGRVVFAEGKFEASGLQTGILKLGENAHVVSKLLIQGGKNRWITVFNNKSPLSLELYNPNKFGALMDENISSSIFNRLFIRHDADPKYFQLTSEKIPAYQIWKIQGDQF